MLEPVCEIASSSHIAISVLRHRMAVEWLVWGMELVGPAIGIVGRAKRGEGLAYPTNVYTLHKNRPALVYLPLKDVACASFTRGFDIIRWFSKLV